MTKSKHVDVSRALVNAVTPPTRRKSKVAGLRGFGRWSSRRGGWVFWVNDMSDLISVVTHLRTHAAAVRMVFDHQHDHPSEWKGIELMGKRHAKMFAGASATFPSCRASVAVHVVR